MKKTFLAMALTAALTPLTFAQATNPPAKDPNQGDQGSTTKTKKGHKKGSKKKKGSTEGGTTANPTK
jgi:hypothetical protein